MPCTNTIVCAHVWKSRTLYLVRQRFLSLSQQYVTEGQFPENDSWFFRGSTSQKDSFRTTIPDSFAIVRHTRTVSGHDNDSWIFCNSTSQKDSFRTMIPDAFATIHHRRTVSGQRLLILWHSTSEKDSFRTTIPDSFAIVGHRRTISGQRVLILSQYYATEGQFRSSASTYSNSLGLNKYLFETKE